MAAARKRQKRRAPRGFPVTWLVLAASVGLIAFAAYGVWLDRVIRTQFEGKRWALPARIYARPLELYSDLRITPAELVQELERLDYQKTARLDRPGSYNRGDTGLDLYVREFRFWDGSEPSRRVRVAFSGDHVSRLAGDAG